jgi:hypothetical protein
MAKREERLTYRVYVMSGNGTFHTSWPSPVNAVVVSMSRRKLLWAWSLTHFITNNEKTNVQSLPSVR